MLNELEFHTSDGYLGEESHIHKNSFLKIDQVIEHPIVKNKDNEDILMETRIYETLKVEEIQRTSYNVQDLLSSMGGLLKIIQTIIALLVYPFAHYMYLISVMQDLYLAKTTNHDVFQKKKHQ